MFLSDRILSFLFQLRIPFRLPRGVDVLDAHKDPVVQEACTAFYRKFYADQGSRTLLLGINPGRFGGGVSGIPFTDPIRLQADCGIPNPFVKKQELSSVFIYEMIAAAGGPRDFYSRFYISSMSPLGFVEQGKNLNYYDHALLLRRIRPFIISCLRDQLSWGLNTATCFCIGEGENHRYLSALNKELGFFKEIVALPHPRFVMQYRLRSKQEYIDLYLGRLGLK